MRALENKAVGMGLCYSMGLALGGLMPEAVQVMGAGAKESSLPAGLRGTAQCDGNVLFVRVTVVTIALVCYRKGIFLSKIYVAIRKMFWGHCWGSHLMVLVLLHAKYMLRLSRTMLSNHVLDNDELGT